MTLGAHGATVALRALRNEPCDVALHLGPPGTDGTANPAGETRRLRARFTSPTGQTMTAPPMRWRVVTATETYTDFTVWSGTNFLGAGTLEQPVEARMGDDVTVTVTWRIE